MIPIRSNNTKGAIAEYLTNYEFTIAAAGVSANTAISPAIGANQRLIVHSINGVVHASTSVVAGIRLGFAAATLPAAAASPVAGILFGAGALLAGSIFHGNPGMGQLGEELRVTATNPTGGSIVISFLAEIVTV
jgi:hypothetical protein